MIHTNFTEVQLEQQKQYIIHPWRNKMAREQADEFSSKLIERGFDVRVFDPAGQDTIGGGCGQLFATQKWAQINIDKIHQSAGDKAHDRICL